MDDSTGLKGTYQETLRTIGAWLDVRGYRDIRIVEDAGDLVIEASDSSRDASHVEFFRLDREGIERMRHAARNDRGSALSHARLLQESTQ